MFGYNVGQIVKGHLNEIAHKEEQLSKSRLAICRQCPLYTEGPLGPMCDAKKCYNEKLNLTSTLPGQGFVCGCGCRLKAKTTLKEAKCVLNKW